MKSTLDMLQLVFNVFLSCTKWFLGGVDGLLYALIIFVLVDCITRALCAMKNRNLTCKAVFDVISKKALIFLLVGLSNVIDVQVIGSVNILRTVVILFYISNEGISLLQNASNLGLIIPEKMREVLDLFRDQSKKDK